LKPIQADMPPLRELRAALRRTTEYLARELRAPSAAAPAWNELEWSVARAVAVMQGITSLLANRLRWRGPDSWHEFVESQRDLALRRDTRIETLLTRLDTTMRASGLSCIGLKGSALRPLGIYRPGERPMGDVDLLVRSHDIQRAAQGLHALDYALSFETQRHAVYAPTAWKRTARFGEDPDNALKIEVHTSVAEALPVEVVEISTHWLDSGMALGINAYPARAELMRHLLLHAAGNMRAHALRQIQLHDIAMLGRLFREADWQRLLDVDAARGGAWWMLPPVALTERYYPGSFAPRLLAELAAVCPPLLRRQAERVTLTEVSWSNLRIAAFPGISWARSPAEALRFARGRIFPSRVALEELRAGVVTMPALAKVDWYGISHLQRILRWTLGRAPRAQTLSTLMAAREMRH
jgi:hypothetical protein